MNEKEKLKQELKEEFNLDDKSLDVFDFDAEWSDGLNFEENSRLIKEKCRHLLGLNETEVKKMIKEEKATSGKIEEQQKKNFETHISDKKINQEWDTIDLDKFKSVAILGDTNSSKSNLAVYHLRNYKGKRKIYTLGYPRQLDNFTQLSSFRDVFQLTDAVIFIDELNQFIKVYDRKANYDLMELISLFAHQNNTLVFTTCLSQFITQGVEAFIDCWLLTRMNDLANLKNGSKPKRIIQNTFHPKCNKWSLSLANGEYLEFSELNEIGKNGVKVFPDQKIGKDWKTGLYSGKNSEQNVSKSSEINNADKKKDGKKI